MLSKVCLAMIFLAMCNGNRLHLDNRDRYPASPFLKHYHQVAASFEVSRKNLRTDYLDGLLLPPLADFDEMMAVWGAMEQIQQEGGAGRIGISNCYDLAVLKQLHHQAAIKPAVVQNRFYDKAGYDKAPVVFVHGMGGSAREFSEMVVALDWG